MHKKTVGVQPAADGKGVVVVLKKRAGELLTWFPSSGTSWVCKTSDLLGVIKLALPDVHKRSFNHLNANRLNVHSTA